MENEKTYLHFLEQCAELAKVLSAEEIVTEICSTVKNNGVQVHGILIKKQGEAIAPNFYLMGHYNDWLCGRTSMEEIAKGMLLAYEEELKKNREIAGTLRFEWEDFKQHVYVRLVGRDRNEMLLKEIPYDEYLDMALVYHYLVEISEETRGVLVVTNHHLEMLGVTKEELREAALYNTMQKRKPVIKKINDMIFQMEEKLGISMKHTATQNFMYILGNAEGEYGAVSMLFSEELERFSNELRGGFYILPSSVHEVILVPDTGEIPAIYFSYMVREVNATQVEASEVLTDSVYYYDREIHAVRRVA